MKNVDRYSRAGQRGRIIECSKCGTLKVVYHFGWAALGCIGCKEVVTKKDFLVAELSKEESWKILGSGVEHPFTIDASRRSLSEALSDAQFR